MEVNSQNPLSGSPVTTVRPAHILSRTIFGASVPDLRRIASGRLSAIETRKIIDYRKGGEKIDEFRERVKQFLAPYPQHWRGHVADECQRLPRIQAMIDRIAERKKTRERLDRIETATTAYDPDDMLRGWGHGYQCKIGCQDGLTLVLERLEDVTWGKKHHWPDKSISYRSTLYSAKCEKLKSTWFTRRGKWLERLRKEWSLKLSLVSKTKTQKLLKDGGYDPATPDTRIVHRNDDWLIVRADSPAAVQLLSAGTVWCTKNRDHATRYARRGFYVAFKNGKRYAGVSDNECKNGRNEDVPFPPYFQQDYQAVPDYDPEFDYV